MTNCCDFNAESLKGISCNITDNEKGITITIMSDDKEKAEKLKSKTKACCCCDCDDSK